MVLYGEELQVLVADRDQPVRCTPRIVTTSGDGTKAVTLKQCVGCAGEIADRDHDVIDLEHGLSLPPAAESGNASATSAR